MKKIFSIAIAASFLLSCNNTGNTNTTAEKSSSTNSSGKLYFDYTIDGKEMHIDAADVMSTYRASNTDTVFTIHAGKDGATTLLLTVPHDMTKPSVTPSGSSDFKMNISQGSASLQNYPEKNFTSNSFNGTYPEKSPIIPEAIVITSTEKQGEEARIIAGTFNTKTYSDNKETDPKNADHIIKGTFRIKHEFNSFNGGKF